MMCASICVQLRNTHLLLCEYELRFVLEVGMPMSNGIDRLYGIRTGKTKQKSQGSFALSALTSLWRLETDTQTSRKTLQELRKAEDAIAVMTPNHTAGIHLWQFLKELLLQPHLYGQYIRWIDKEKGETTF